MRLVLQLLPGAAGIVLLLLPLIHRLGRKLKLPFDRRMPCPVCGEKPHAMHLQYTGNCSVCGSQIDPEWPPAEPDPVAALPTWEELRRFGRWQSVLSLAVIVIACLLLLFGISKGKMEQKWLTNAGIISAIVVFFVGIMLAAYCSARQCHLPRRCPYCLGKSSQNLHAQMSAFRRYGRCPNCRRRLIRGEETEA